MGGDIMELSDDQWVLLLHRVKSDQYIRVVINDSQWCPQLCLLVRYNSHGGTMFYKPQKGWTRNLVDAVRCSLS